MVIKIAIGADHRGFEQKNWLITQVTISNKEILWVDVGADSTNRSDYPEFAFNVAKLVQSKEVDFGILLCGSGVGMSIAANRLKYVYAGLAWNEKIAQMSKEDDNINVLVLPADYINLQEAKNIIIAWLSAEFKGGRYQSRIDMIDLLS